MEDECDAECAECGWETDRIYLRDGLCAMCQEEPPRLEAVGIFAENVMGGLDKVDRALGWLSGPAGKKPQRGARR